MENRLSFWTDRVLVWFSCGAASAVAAKMAVDKFGESKEIEILYCDTLKYEHPDNARFLADVSKWIGKPIKILKSQKYEDIYDVFSRTGYIAGIAGASCTRLLKRQVRIDYQDFGDIHVFGFTSDEASRIASFERDNDALDLEWILKDNNVTKSDCYRILMEAGIELPAMYRLGYKNNNCIGCVKGGAGYWNKIRVDFPDTFDKMAKFSRKMNVRLIRVSGKRVFLDELPEGVGRYQSEEDFECGPQCVTPKQWEEDAYEEYIETNRVESPASEDQTKMTDPKPMPSNPEIS